MSPGPGLYLDKRICGEIFGDLGRIPGIHHKLMVAIHQFAQKADASRAGTAENQDFGANHLGAWNEAEQDCL